MKMRIAAGIFSGFLAAFLPACDEASFSKLTPGQSSMETVRQVMGPPTQEWTDPDGSQTWEYPRTPEGIVNYMVDISPDKKLRAIRQVLTDEYFGKVQPGMNRDQIRRLLGKPAHERYFQLKKEHVWDWKIKSESGSDTYFNVTFDENGSVTKSFTSIEGKG